MAIKFEKRINHNIQIIPSANNGFIINVGCCSMCYGDSASLLLDLKKFLENPEKIEKDYNEFCYGLDVPQPVGPA